MMFMTPIGGFVRMLNTIVGRATTTYAANITTTTDSRYDLHMNEGFNEFKEIKRKPQVYI